MIKTGKMKDIFSPIFLICLFLLFAFFHLNFFCEIISPFIIVFFGVSVTLFFFKKYKFSYFFVAISISLLITFNFTKIKSDFYEAVNFSIPEEQYISISGKLADFPEIKKDHSIIYLNTEFLEYEKKRVYVSLKIRIKVEGDLKGLYRGDYINIAAKVYKNRFNKNFFKNPFENYVLVRRIHFNGYCKSKQMITLLRKTDIFWKLIGGWRNRIREVIEKKYISTAGNLDRKGVFLEAILIGERAKLNPKQRDELLSSGVYHLLAISGAHIGIIAMFLLILLKFLKVSLKKRYLITGTFLIFFLILSGFKISTQRAVLMAILIFIAKILCRDINIFSIISFSGILILIKNPAEFLDAGFILTYTLTSAIVIGRRIFLDLLNRFPKYFKEFLSANISASLLSLPLSLFFFKRYSFAGFFSGLLLFPLTAVITGIGILLIPIAPISTVISNLILILIDAPLTLFFFIVDFFANVVNLSIFRASPSFLIVVLILIIFYLMGSVFTIKFLKVFLALFFAILILTTIIKINYYKPGNLEAFFLDVGQGDSEIVVFPEGEALLIDGGGTNFSDFEIGKQIVLPFILQKRIKIKWVSVSHYHPDHSKGIIEIINILKPEELWISSEAKMNFFYRDLVNMLNKSIKIKRVAAGFTLFVGNSRIKFLFPDKIIFADQTHNNHSQVIKVSDLYHSFLFTGDIEEGVEGFLSRSFCESIGGDVIKVPHHGSKTSSTIQFLKCVKPQIAVFSYAYSKRSHFPHKKVIENYKKQKTRMFSTAFRGGIKIISLPDSLKVETSK